MTSLVVPMTSELTYTFASLAAASLAHQLLAAETPNHANVTGVLTLLALVKQCDDPENAW
ncbi:hypothetical protein V6U90_26775 [Micromonospora sp. CPCC 206060]|uniref:hypothetical protein n=1 Tax=Micromonospora sp. CPCC 206060 TaxID=3122406 RepID=UPI002FF4133A